MCGFFAGVFPAQDAPTPTEMRAALRSIGHRGPDGSHWIRRTLPDGRIAVLGHVRLAVVSIEDGRQPFVSETHATVVNGELYDWVQDRERLRRAGAVFRTWSDSEVVHHSYAGSHSRWMRDLDGEWAAAIVDFTDGSVDAACDPYGTKPLRWWSSDDGRSFVVASEAKALFALGVRPELDMAALRFSMSMQYLPSGSTLFKGVSMLPPGHRILNHAGRTTVHPWTNTILSLGDPHRSPATARELRGALHAAVSKRIPNERSFGTHLSGGLDSAIVTALAMRSGGATDAFVADFSFGPNETEQARVTAEHVGANLVPVRIDVRDMLDASHEAVRMSESLCMNGHAAAKILIAQRVREHGHRCVLTGEGADEGFWGYEHLRIDSGLAMHDGAAGNTAGVHRPGGGQIGDLSLLEKEIGGPAPTFVRAKLSMTAALRTAFGHALRDVPFDPVDMCLAMPREWMHDLQRHRGPRTARALWNVHGLSGYILRGLDDAMGMSRGVESRLPLLDLVVQEMASRTAPIDHFDTDGLEKRLLREAAAIGDLVPESVLRRRKAPFMAPMLTNTPEGEAWARERLFDGRLVAKGLFEEEGLERMLDAPTTPATDAVLMKACSLSILMDQYDL